MGHTLGHTHSGGSVLVAIAVYTPLDSSSRFGWVLVQYPYKTGRRMPLALQMAMRKLQRSGRLTETLTAKLTQLTGDPRCSCTRH